MQNIKYIFSIIFLLSLSNYVNGQEKKRVYFLVDTVNISKENRVADISGKGEIAYTFYCQCLKKQNIIFTYLNSQGGPIAAKLPRVDYLSWKSFLQIVDNNILKFARNYELFITEVLPNKKYKTSKVHIGWQRESAN